MRTYFLSVHYTKSILLPTVVIVKEKSADFLAHLYYYNVWVGVGMNSV